MSADVGPLAAPRAGHVQAAAQTARAVAGARVPARQLRAARHPAVLHQRRRLQRTFTYSNYV